MGTLSPVRGSALGTLVAVLALAAAGPARGGEFFGPQTAGSFQPELDAYFRLADGLRLQAQLQPYLVPEQGYAQVTYAAYASWLVADVLADVLSPDQAKKHVVDVRAGLLYTQTVAQGTQGPGNVWTLQLDLTTKGDLPGTVLLSLRNRVTANWMVDGAQGFYFRYRARLQAEREFPVGQIPITPYVNAEFFWQQPPAMWTQFRLQAGVQVGFDLFARGQTIEVNYVAITSLQPSRSWSPQLGLILSSWF